MSEMCRFEIPTLEVSFPLTQKAGVVLAEALAAFLGREGDGVLFRLLAEDDGPRILWLPAGVPFTVTGPTLSSLDGSEEIVDCAYDRLVKRNVIDVNADGSLIHRSK